MQGFEIITDVQECEDAARAVFNTDKQYDALVSCCICMNFYVYLDHQNWLII